MHHSHVAPTHEQRKYAKKKKQKIKEHGVVIAQAQAHGQIKCNAMDVRSGSVDRSILCAMRVNKSICFCLASVWHLD